MILRHRQTPWTDSVSSLLFAALGKAEPLVMVQSGERKQTDRRTLPSALSRCFAKLRVR